MSETQHTQLPWNVRDAYFVKSDAEGGRWIANCDRSRDGDEANAEFIVRACNAHHDLLAVCEKLLSRTSVGAKWDDDLCAAARATIAKAKGEQTKDTHELE